MNQPKLAKKIRYHAYRARKIAEKIAKEEGFAEDLYEFCARGAAILWKELDRAGLKSEIVYNPGHVFVLCSGWYVDITATQFGLGKTMVRTEESARKLSNKVFSRHGERLYPDWHAECAWATFNNPISLQAWQQYSGWLHQPGIVKVTDLEAIKKVFKPTPIAEGNLLASNDFGDMP